MLDIPIQGSWTTPMLANRWLERTRTSIERFQNPSSFFIIFINCIIILINCIIILILIIREELYSHDETEELNGLESGQGSGPQRKKGNYGALKFEA